MGDLSGLTVDRYRIIERLGMGGMAVVYKAYDTRLERDVALKFIRTENIPPANLENLLKRFEREAKAQAQFSQANIVRVFDYGEYEGSPYLVMEYLPGGTLKSIAKGKIPFQKALEYVIPIAEALEYAHQRKVLHRDVKPGNILISEEGKPMLTDFGIAKLLETDEATLTGTGMGVGTPEYMAPEQWQGKPVPQTDIYALGVVFYQLVTGRRPYSADTPGAVAILQATEPLPRPTQFAADLPEQVEKMLFKALAREPEDRYESMTAFIEALKACVGLEPGEVTAAAAAPEPVETVVSEAETVDEVEEQASGVSLETSPETNLMVEPEEPRKVWAAVWISAVGFALSVLLMFMLNTVLALIVSQVFLALALKRIEPQFTRKRFWLVSLFPLFPLNLAIALNNIRGIVWWKAFGYYILVSMGSGIITYLEVAFLSALGFPDGIYILVGILLFGGLIGGGIALHIQRAQKREIAIGE